jgi:hypothetical protein
MVYRATASMDRALEAVDASVPSQALKAIEEYAIECSILKVYGSESLDFIVDEAVQIHGGYGYSAEYAVERYYRDSRVNRIFEGTNEINRLVIFGMLLKRAAAGRLAFHDAVREALEYVWSGQSSREHDGPLRAERAALGQARQSLLFSIGLALGKHAEGVRDEQELVMRFADMTIDIYAMDTIVARALKGAAPREIERDAIQLFFEAAMARVSRAAAQAVIAVTDGDQRRDAVQALRRTLEWTPVDTIRCGRRVAEHLLENRGYTL